MFSKNCDKVVLCSVKTTVRELPLIVHLAPPLLIPAFIEGQSQRGVNISVATRVPTRCYPAQHSVCVTSIDINTSTHQDFQRVVMSCHTASSDNVITTSRSQCYNEEGRVNHKHRIEYKVLHNCIQQPPLPGQYRCLVLTSTTASHQLMFVRVFVLIHCQFHQ